MSTKISTSVNIAGVELKNPVMTASGTFGSGAEYSEFVDLSKLGAQRAWQTYRGRAIRLRVWQKSTAAC